jgi:HNH endonuclease
MVPNSTRQLVRQRAQFLCEYCHSPEAISPDRFTIDHIQPQSKGGSDDLSNLALACHRCNERRSNATIGSDPQTDTSASLFNPRQHHWYEHFIWTYDRTEILGITAIGRATCDRLDLNDLRYNHEDSIRKVRQIWVHAGWHPPMDDPVQSG